MEARPEKVILIVDDERDVLLLFQMLMKRKVSVCHVATNGQEALEVIRKVGHLDCVITDISMPDMDGFELKEKMDELIPGVPVIGVTGHSDEDIMDRMRKAGFEHIIGKPVDREKLHEILEVVSGESSAQ
ncbi:MAG TPA: hypothetical protein DEA96_15830 [Leptospiraceae bacterium]|nr:hypothetical protein [Spirochaetaceae bacterium]HBS06438.1 hypothetical protein [Leptospiraceae bacterium]